MPSELLAPETGQVQGLDYSALVLPGGARTLTSWPSLGTDIRNAGGNWLDTEVRLCTSVPTRW